MEGRSGGRAQLLGEEEGEKSSGVVEGEAREPVSDTEPGTEKDEEAEPAGRADPNVGAPRVDGDCCGSVRCARFACTLGEGVDGPDDGAGEGEMMMFGERSCDRPMGVVAGSTVRAGCCG